MSDEQVTRWSIGEAFVEALRGATDAPDVVATIMKPVNTAMEEAFVVLCDDIRDRMADALNDEVRQRTDKIIEALLAGDERLLGTFMAAGGYRMPNIEWDGRFRSGYWVEVRQKIVEANERILTNERIADLTAERDALAAEIPEKTSALGKLRGELAEAIDALHWAKVRLGEPTDDR